MSCDDLAGERATALAVLHHHLVATLVRRREPVGVALTLLAHRVEAERVQALGRDARVQPRLQHVLGHALCVFADLGDRDVAVDDVDPGVLQRGLQRAQRRPVRRRAP